MQLSPNKMKWFLRVYGPFVGAGVWVESISPDWKELKVSMKQRFYNKNAVGTHFGGSLYAMTDPHYMLMIMNLLGKGYLVWDKSASIEFIKPGKGKVFAAFIISDEVIEKIIQKTKDGSKYLPQFEVDVIDSQGDIVAKVCKTLYIRKKIS